MTDDRERLDRYLEWRRAEGRGRSARRRRRLRLGAGAAGIGVVAVAGVAWLRGDALTRSPAPPVAQQTAPAVGAPAARPPSPAPSPLARRPATVPPHVRPIEPERPESPAAGITPVEPASAMPEPIVTAPTPRATPQPLVAAPPAPDTAVDPAPPTAPTESAGAVAPAARPRRRVVRWLDGEVQEFRDGVKREIGDFRAGYDVLRRRVRDLGAKLRE